MLYINKNSISGTTVFSTNYCNSIIFFSTLQCSSPVISLWKTGKDCLHSFTCHFVHGLRMKACYATCSCWHLYHLSSFYKLRNLCQNTDLWLLMTSKTKNMVTISIAFSSPAMHNSVRTSPRPIFGSQPTSWKPLVCSPSMSGRDREGGYCCYNLPVKALWLGQFLLLLSFFVVGWGGDPAPFYSTEWSSHCYLLWRGLISSLLSSVAFLFFNLFQAAIASDSLDE